MEEVFHNLSAQKALLLSHSMGHQLNNHTQLPMGIRRYLHQLVRRKGIGGRLSKPMLLTAIISNHAPTRAKTTHEQNSKFGLLHLAHGHGRVRKLMIDHVDEKYAGSCRPARQHPVPNLCVQSVDSVR